MVRSALRLRLELSLSKFKLVALGFVIAAAIVLSGGKPASAAPAAPTPAAPTAPAPTPSQPNAATTTKATPAAPGTASVNLNLGDTVKSRARA